MYTVILAEKPNVARDIAAALKEVRLKNGEILETKHIDNPKYEPLIREARKEGYFQGTKHIITYAQGHLFTLKEPNELDPALKKWEMGTLPFHFTDIPLRFIDAGSRKQFEVIKKLFNNPNVDKIIVATDADREGEHIFRTIYKQTGSRKPFWRMWIKDATERGILEAYRNMKPGHLYDGLADAAKCRAEADYLVGMNLTRAATLQFGGYKNVLSVGRVQTPTLAILVNREKEIQNFVPKDYWVLKAVFGHKNGDFEAQWFRGDEDRFWDKAAGDAVLAKVRGQNGVLAEVKTKQEREGNPSLFNLTDLQKVAGKATGLSPAKILDIAQALYDEHKLITYPRSSSRHIASGTGATARERLENLKAFFPDIIEKPLRQGWNMNKSFIDDAKTASHEAIIPTFKKPDFSKLSQEERTVYEIIVKRFVAAFYPPCVWEHTTAVVEVAGETFKATGKALKQAGWREVEGIPNTNVLPALAEQDPVEGKAYDLEAKKTQPPKRILETEMPAVMENAGKFIEDDELRDVLKGAGIGTEATRGTIIAELIKRGYVKVEKKYLVPTEKGMGLIDTLPVALLKSPEMTARWEQKLADIEEGKLSRKQFMAEMKEAITEMVEQVRRTSGKVAASGKAAPGKKVICACPKCGGDIVENERAYSCSGWKNGCKVTIWKNAMERYGKKKITATEAKQLLTKGRTAKKVKLHSPTKGKDYEAYLVMDDTGRIVQAF